MPKKIRLELNNLVSGDQTLLDAEATLAGLGINAKGANLVRDPVTNKLIAVDLPDTAENKMSPAAQAALAGKPGVQVARLIPNPVRGKELDASDGITTVIAHGGATKRGMEIRCVDEDTGAVLAVLGRIDSGGYTKLDTSPAVGILLASYFNKEAPDVLTFANAQVGTFDGTDTILVSDTSDLAATDVIEPLQVTGKPFPPTLHADGRGFVIQSVVPNTSVTVTTSTRINQFIGTFPLTKNANAKSGSTGSVQIDTGINTGTALSFSGSVHENDDLVSRQLGDFKVPTLFGPGDTAWLHPLKHLVGDEPLFPELRIEVYLAEEPDLPGKNYPVFATLQVLGTLITPSAPQLGAYRPFAEAAEAVGC